MSITFLTDSRQGCTDYRYFINAELMYRLQIKRDIQILEI